MYCIVLCTIAKFNIFSLYTLLSESEVSENFLNFFFRKFSHIFDSLIKQLIHAVNACGFFFKLFCGFSPFICAHELWIILCIKVRVVPISRDNGRSGPPHRGYTIDQYLHSAPGPGPPAQGIYHRPMVPA